MAGHAQLKIVMTECSKTQIRLTGPNYQSFMIKAQNKLADHYKGSSTRPNFARPALFNAETVVGPFFVGVGP